MFSGMLTLTLLISQHVDTDDIMVEEEQRLAELGEDTIGAPSNTTTPVVVRTVPGHSKVAVMTTPVSEQYPRALPRQLGGLIGHNKGIALTPLASLKHADLHLGEIASPCSVATDHTPTNKSVAAGASSADADARLTRILKRLAGGQSTDAHFLKLSSMAEKYVRERDHGSSFGAGSGGKSERVRVYCERFPEVLSTLLGVLDMPDEVVPGWLCMTATCFTPEFRTTF